jgi:DNA (cytosine-5)-methyltransferase 1
VEHRELVAADYGAPTSRKRFVLCARCDGRPIIWPERTHAPAGSPEVLSGKCLPWRSAAEILDFSRPCPSIFDTKAEIKAKYGLKAQRPLADNTLRRIICGTDKFTIKSAKPYIIPVGYGQRTSFLMQYHDEKGGKARVNGVEEPLATVDAANRHGLCSVQLTEFYGNGRPLEVESPLRTVTAKDREALTLCHLDKYYGGGYTGVGNSLLDPLTTVTAEPRHSLAAVHVQKYYGGIVGSDVEDPLPTVTSVDHNALAAVHVAVFKGKDKGQDARTPLRTITAANEFAEVRVRVVKYDEDMAGNARRYGHWPEIRALLNKYCGYSLADDELLLLNIGGIWYYISDIGLRMLTPRELYAAMGFPSDYAIDRDYLGNEYPKDQQIAKCGNSVPPPLAEAMVRANLPEWCGQKIETMNQFRKVVAV